MRLAQARVVVVQQGTLVASERSMVGLKEAAQPARAARPNAGGARRPRGFSLMPSSTAQDASQAAPVGATGLGRPTGGANGAVGSQKAELGQLQGRGGCTRCRRARTYGPAMTGPDTILRVERRRRKMPPRLYSEQEKGGWRVRNPPAAPWREACVQREREREYNRDIKCAI